MYALRLLALHTVRLERLVQHQLRMELNRAEMEIHINTLGLTAAKPVQTEVLAGG